MRPGNKEIDGALKEQGIRITQARRSIYCALLGASDPLSAAQIGTMLHDADVAIDLVTVYRTLDTLERCGLITRVDRLHEGWRYAIRSKGHHHSIVCSECGSAAPLASCDLQRIEQSLAQSTGFVNVSHSLQFYGTCPNCRG
jgi:Fe2+ or Zn2+ uptake regulation protein